MVAEGQELIGHRNALGNEGWNLRPRIPGITLG